MTSSKSPEPARARSLVKLAHESAHAVKLLPGWGRILAVDLHPDGSRPGFDFTPREIGRERGARQLLQALTDERPALVMSEMAPNMCGMAELDHHRSMHLLEPALDFIRGQVQAGGDFPVQASQGCRLWPAMQQSQPLFASVKVRKPPASRSRNPESHLLARHLQHQLALP